MSLLIPLVTATITAIFGCAALLKEPKSKPNRLLCLTASTVVVSLAGIIGSQFSNSPTMMVVWAQTILLGIIAFPPVGFSFSKEFVKSYFPDLEHGEQRLFWFYAACSSFFLLLLPGRGITKTIALSRSAFVFEFTIFGELLLIYFLLALIHIAIILEPIFYSTRTSSRRLKWLVTSYLATTVFLITSGAQLLLGMELPIWMLWIGCGFMTVLFTSYGFFELKNRVDRLYLSSKAVYSSILLLSTGTYFVVLGLSGYLIKNNDGNWQGQLPVISSIAAFLMFLLLLLSSKMKDRIKSFWRQNIYQKHFDYREEWQHFSKQISGSMDLQAISDNVVGHISDLFRVPNIGLYLRKKDTRFFDLIAKKINHRSIPANIELSESELANLSHARYNSNLNIAMLKSADSKGEESGNSCVVLALRVEDTILGFLYCERASALKQEAFELLTLFVNQTALAIHNLQLTTKLLESKELESFNKVTSFIIHDLRNHIAVLSMLVANTKKYAHQIEFRESVTEALKKTVNEMKALLSKINFARVENDNDTQRLSLNELIHEVVNELNLSNRTVDVQFVERYSKIPSILAKRSSFISLVRNFCLNAIEAMPSGGTVTIETRCVCNSPAPNHVTSDLKQAVEIRFIDDGIGMSEEFVRDKLFHPFSSTKRFGLGIGLFHCKEIVNALGGYIEVTSALNQGTVFTISLPVSKGHDDKSLEKIVENALILAS